MMTLRALWLGTLICFITVTASAQNPLDLLKRVSKNYQNLRSFEFVGHLTTTVPGTKLEMRFGTANAEAGSEFVPAGSTVRKYEGFTFTDGKMIEAEGKPRNSSLGGAFAVSMPPHLGNYEHIDTEVKYAKELFPEVIEVEGSSVECVVLEVLYDRRGWQPEERSVKYWIDANRLMVFQQAVATLQDADDTSIVWHWIYKIDSVKLNQPPPKWLIDYELSRSHADHRIPEWIGKEAPNFNLPDLDGHKVDLLTMRGKVVLLDFWATWCVPCIEEMPIIERIENDYKDRDLEIWGISREKADHVKEWMLRKERKLHTVIDRWGNASKQYRVEGIPSIVVIDRAGKIVSYYLGNQPEQSLRAAIDLALENSPTKDK